MIPFIYGKVAMEEDFIDREQETRILVAGFESRVNQIIISPRRWGKTSLVHHAAAQAIKEDKNLKIVFIDIFNVRTEDEFFEKFAYEVVRQTASAIDEMARTVRQFITSVIPTFSLGGPDNQLTMSLKYEGKPQDREEILDLPERIAEDKGCKVVVCIDEFQQIGNFKDPRHFQARLRTHWQHHQKASYCLYGSRRHMMMTVFGDASMPFYKFGNTIFLQKIDAHHWTDYITERFENAGKHITKELCELIVRLVDNNPYYVQQLSQLSWLYTQSNSDCTEEIIHSAFEDIVNQQEELNRQLTLSLTLGQQRLLKAMVNRETRLTSSETLSRYALKSSAEVANAKRGLAAKDIVDFTGNGYSFEDPIYEYWLKNRFFVEPIS